MANIYCDDGYCEPTGKESTNTKISDKVVIGGYILFMIALTAMGLWYCITFL